MEPVTVLIPVGPNYSPEWLQEAFDSAVNQTYTPQEILIIDDGADLFNNGDHHYPFMPGEHLLQNLLSIPQETVDKVIKEFNQIEQSWTYRFSLPVIVSGHESHISSYYSNEYTWYNQEKEITYRIWKSPANVGFVAAFNLGVGLSNNELIMYLAADDKLMPDAVEKAVATWEANNRKDAWYPCKYIDSDGVECDIPNNLAMTTKHFFLDMCGGYPPAAFVGPDAALLSCLQVHAPDRIIPVQSDGPLYWIRNHDMQETKIHTWRFVPEMNSIRDKLTQEFKFKNE